MEYVLLEVEKNNLAIKANKVALEAQQLNNRVGLTPVNPVAEYEFMTSGQSNVGNQQDFTLKQEFDFPSVYFKRSKIASLKNKLIVVDANSFRQRTLLEAKLICIDIVYRSKLKKHLEQVELNTRRIYNDFKVMLEKGEGNVLDMQKAKMQLIGISSQVRENDLELNILRSQLVSLNGGVTIDFQDTIYSPGPAVADSVEWMMLFDSKNPLLLSMKSQTDIAQQELALSKAAWFPKFSVGYRYQGILGATFQGVHTGVSIPLWENIRTVRLQKYKVDYSAAELENLRNSEQLKANLLLKQLLLYKNTLNEFDENSVGLNFESLMLKSINSGHVSSIVYFNEMNQYLQFISNYLETERKYHSTLALLNKYLL